ncbi:MAG: hypothetical protein NT075_20160, partial [Chloroflexi bacterium]|nr:hypothetical protein [Chloroflexota bacterium]
YTLPRGFERFRAYLRTMLDDETGDLKLPLVGMNPMGKEHLPIFLDQLIALEADDEAARATAAAEAALPMVAGHFQVTTIVSDDLMGGWTNRYASEFGYRFGSKALHKRGWLAVLLWTSEIYTPARVRDEVLIGIYRLAYIQQHGYAHTLAEMLTQEGYAMALAGVTTPALDDDDLAYTQQVLTPYRDQTGEPTLIAALFGDQAARELGYTPLGLSPRAGFALALAEARVARDAAIQKTLERYNSIERAEHPNTEKE